MMETIQSMMLNLSLSYQLTKLAAKNNKNIASVFHNDLTRFSHSGEIMRENRVKYLILIKT